MSTAILVRKAMRGFNRSRLVLPILSEVLLFVYCAAYAAGVPVARDSDITTVSRDVSAASAFAGACDENGTCARQSKICRALFQFTP